MKFWALLLVILAQIAVLAGEYGNAVYPLWKGEEIQLKTIPVDPRSLFRGNYARLNYEISRVKSPSLDSDTKVRKNELVYVELQANEEGIHEFKQLHLTPPPSGTYIRGRLENRHRYDGHYRIRYGIEAYFAPKEKALALENQLRNSAIAKIMLTDNGKASLKAVVTAENANQ